MATRTWTGLGADKKWDTAGNWSDSTAPGAADTALFTGIVAKGVTAPLAAISVALVTVAADYAPTDANVDVMYAGVTVAGLVNCLGYCDHVGGTCGSFYSEFANSAITAITVTGTLTIAKNFSNIVDATCANFVCAADLVGATVITITVSDSITATGVVTVGGAVAGSATCSFDNAGTSIIGGDFGDTTVGDALAIDATNPLTFASLSITGATTVGATAAPEVSGAFSITGAVTVTNITVSGVSTVNDVGATLSGGTMVTLNLYSGALTGTTITTLNLWGTGAYHSGVVTTFNVYGSGCKVDSTAVFPGALFTNGPYIMTKSAKLLDVTTGLPLFELSQLPLRRRQV